jgi:hypothetical protein
MELTSLVDKPLVSMTSLVDKPLVSMTSLVDKPLVSMTSLVEKPLVSMTSLVEKPLVSMTSFFSCVGEQNTEDSLTGGAPQSNVKIINTDNIDDKGITVTDSYIAVCNINVTDEKVVGHIYACNLDKPFLLNNNLNKKIPMLRLTACKHSETSRWNLAEISAWFFPTDSTLISSLLKLNSKNKYNDINLKGTIKFRIVTWNDNSKVKDCIWTNDYKLYPESQEKFVELMCTNETFISMVQKECDVVNDNNKKMFEYLFTPPNRINSK